MNLFFHYLSLPYLLNGIEFTLDVTGLGLLGGLLVGVALATMQLSRFRVLAVTARAYTVIFRGTPLILQMVFAYDALPHLGLKLSAVAAASLALACNEGPFIAEILRAGVMGVDRGQVLAGQTLGMTPTVLMRRVVAPQAIRSMVPAFGNQAVGALKNSSLASVIAVEELTLRSTQLASTTFDFFSIFFASGLIYLGLTGAVGLIQVAIERLLDLDRPSVWEMVMRLLSGRLDSTAATTSANIDKPNDFALERPTILSHLDSVDRDKRFDRLSRNNDAVTVEGLRKRYGRQTVLDGVDLKVKMGEVVALLGPSGSGKSTLLRCILNLESWDAGMIQVGGRRLAFDDQGRQLSARGIANQRADIGVGMVFQQFNLFGHLSALENIAGPLRWVHGLSRTDARRRALELLDRVGLRHRADALPRHLSGGQQQRVAIARAVAPNPSVLLLDEPTSALDPELVNEVLEVIQRLAIEDGLTMIISTHQLRFAEEVADRVIFLGNGAIIEEGPAQDILHRPKHPLTARFLRVMESERLIESAPR